MNSPVGPQPSPAPGALTAVVLAAGAGTRMRSSRRAKVLHEFAGRSLLAHVLHAVSDANPARTAVVVGHRGEQVEAALAELGGLTTLAVHQHQQRGTGHAVRVALDALAVGEGAVLVVPGDAPLLRGSTLAALLTDHQRTGAVATLLTSIVADPTGYGRIVRSSDGSVIAVVEERDATADQKSITEVAAGVYAFDAAALNDTIRRLSTDNSQREEYLPEVVSLLVAAGRPVHALITDPAEIAGVNDQQQLAAARRIFNDRLIAGHLAAGVCIVDPATTWLDAEVRIAPDAMLWPNVQLRGSTHIGAGAEIGPDCTLTDTVVGPDSTVNRAVAIQARIGAGVSVGPFAYLRPGTDLADRVHIGTFVELKNSDVGAGSKVPHLTYVGDASIGQHTNIGAASVFVNYDGVDKHRSRVGDHARTGADTMFVAPVTVGDGAYTAAGSIITEDVPPGALAVARSPQRNVAGWVARNRPGTAAATAAVAADAATGFATAAAAELGSTDVEGA